MTAPVEHVDALEKWSVGWLGRRWRRSTFSPIKAPIKQLDVDHWQPLDPWKGDAHKGQTLASGSHPTELDSWHRFDWLRDMRDYGGSQARTLARRFALQWCEQNRKWSETVWHPQLISDRLANITLTWGWFAASANAEQQQTLAHMLAAHQIALERDWTSLRSVNLRIKAIRALILSSAFLDASSVPDKWGDLLISEVLSALLADGCHATRQPDLHLDLLKSLIDARIGISAMIARIDNPQQNILEMAATLDETIIRMGMIARMWRHHNGEMMRLLGADEIGLDAAEEILDRTGAKGRVRVYASDSGFIRMASSRSVLLMNTAPAPWALPLVMEAGGRPEAGANAIEFSHGNTPIITNAGQQKNFFADNPELAEALAGTAGHSTLSVDQSNAADITADGLNGRLATARQTETGPAPGGLLAENIHDGFEQKFGLTHLRRIFLATGGNNLRGEDALIYSGAPGLVPQEAVIRFHLHPRITAQMSLGGDVLLKLPGNAAPWQFKARGGEIRVEESVVLIHNKITKSSQITLTMTLGDIKTTTAKWALRRQVAPRR